MRRRRVEIHIEHREVRVFARPGMAERGQPLPRFAEARFAEARFAEAGLAGATPAHAADSLPMAMLCPTCGEGQLQTLEAMVLSPHVNFAALQTRIAAGSLHVHRAPDGAWWVCGDPPGEA